MKQVKGVRLRLFPHFRVIFLVLLWVGLCGVVHADGAFYVSAQGGDDTSGDGSTNLPWKTLTKAFSALNDTNQSVHLFPGVYGTNTGEVFPLQTTVSVVRVVGYDPAGTASPTNHIIDSGKVAANLFSIAAGQQVYLTSLTCSNMIRAAVYMDGAIGVISNCVFRDSSTTGDTYPAAVQQVNNSRLTALDCAFMSLRGKGAIGHEVGSQNTDNRTWCTNCTFERVISAYGTLYAPNGVTGGKFYLSQCRFQANGVTGTGRLQDGDRGIGVYIYNATTYGSILIDRCRFLNNTNGTIAGGSRLAAAASIRNTLFVNNQFEHLICGYQWGATFDNCTLIGNKGSLTGYSESRGVKLRNCIVVSNQTALSTSGANCSFYNSLFYQTSLGTYDEISSVNLYTNVNPSLKGDWSLAGGSPAIDVGNNAYMSDASDLAGGVRRVDGDVNGTTNVDLGCYEFNPAGSGAMSFRVAFPSYTLFAGRSLNLPVWIGPAAAGAVQAGVTYPTDLTGTNLLDYPAGGETNTLMLTASSTLSVPNGTLVSVGVVETNTSQGVAPLDIGVRLYEPTAQLNPSPVSQRLFVRAGTINLIRVELEDNTLQAPGDITITPGGVSGSGNNQLTWVGGAAITNTGWQSAGYLQVIGASGNNAIDLTLGGGFVFSETGLATLTLQVEAFSSPLYVANTGSDVTGNGALGTPLKTIGYATSLLSTGDEVRLFPGTYSTNTGEVFPLQPGGVRLVGYDVGAVWSPSNHVINGSGRAVNLVSYDSSVTGCYLANLMFSNVTRSAVILNASRLSMSNCVVRDIASGGYPGGVWLWNNSWLTAVDTEFRNLNGKGAVGVEDGVIADNNNNVWATHCQFVGNYSSYGTLYADTPCAGRFFLTQCTFQGNRVPDATQQDSYSSSAVYIFGPIGPAHTLQVDRCRFLDNTNGILFGITRTSDVQIKNSLFVNNQCTYAMLYGYGWGASMVNCTLVENKGVLSGWKLSSGGNLYLRNSIVDGNGADDISGLGLVIQTSLVWQATIGLYVTNSSGGIIINTDPLLVADYSPDWSSPVLNAGNNVWMTDPYDLVGTGRIRQGIVDLGAFEVIRIQGTTYVLR